MPIIGLSGKKQSGKSTLAVHLMDKHRFIEASWAYPLKVSIGQNLLGLSYNQLFGTEEDKETIDKFWGKSPRELLQIIGTDCFRNLVDPDFWVKVGIRYIEDLQARGIEDIVISDCRFPNEMDAIKELGGISVRVEREGYYTGDYHPSETSLDNYEHDYTVLAGTGDIEGLKLRIDQIVELK
jgi:hypothetical protein